MSSHTSFYHGKTKILHLTLPLAILFQFTKVFVLMRKTASEKNIIINHLL